MLGKLMKYEWKNKNPRKILVPAEREKLIPKSGGKEKAYGFTRAS